MQPALSGTAVEKLGRVAGAAGALFDAGKTFSLICPVLTAPRDTPDTFTAMPTNQSLALKRRSDHIINNLRGVDERCANAVSAEDNTTLAEILTFPVVLPDLAMAPTTRQLDSTCRITARIGGVSIGEVLGWECGPLDVTADGLWQVLRPSAVATCQRFDGKAVLSGAARDRLRLPVPLCRSLSVNPGDEVVLLALPDQGALALTNPRNLLIGAPLQVLTTLPK